MIKNRWFELYYPSDNIHWCLQYTLPYENSDNLVNGVYRARLVFGFWRLFLIINLWKTEPVKDDSNSYFDSRYGLTFFDRSVHFHWDKTHVKDLPWAWEIVRYDLLLPTGELYHRNKYPIAYLKDNSVKSWCDILYDGNTDTTSLTETVEILQRNSDGSIQRAQITLCGEEREWRWRWFKWLPWPRRVTRVVDCNSDIEIGVRAGTWKGGMTGWSCEWQHGESMKKAFWRWYSKWDGK